MAAAVGFEPTVMEPKSIVLPLDDAAKFGVQNFGVQNSYTDICSLSVDFCPLLEKLHNETAMYHCLIVVVFFLFRVEHDRNTA